LRLQRSWVVIGVLLLSSAAEASVRLGVGADWWVNTGGVFEALIEADARIARHVSVGGRLGAGIATPSNSLAVPIDLDLRLHFPDVYLEGLAGPWVLVNSPTSVRAHAAMGFGYQGSGVSIGIEGGWLDSAAVLGLRLMAEL
jgi:hypothetical protein